ncbi:MAG: hypothetical protein LQ348_002547 [Seirophora lacunosa]|nr:MAG: hypothetical protein LQ348_002547 [Seirophora lacunosa]
MEVHTPVMDHPKKRRRRRKHERSPLSATLIADAALQGEEGLLSLRLYQQLFPWAEETEKHLVHIAVSPWLPQASKNLPDVSWTILPVRIQQQTRSNLEEVEPDSTVRYPASTSTIQAILAGTRDTSTSKTKLKGNIGARILLLDVQPAQLTNVYVTVDGDALRRHEQIQKEFGGGFGALRKSSQVDHGKGKTVSEDTLKDKRDKEVTDAVRSALASSLIVRQGGFLALPLPAHPITHVPLPPARVSLCEPVDQGLLSPHTNIVVERRFSSGRRKFRTVQHHAWNPSPVAIGDGEETSNEKFYSAIEDGVDGLASQSEADDASSLSNSSGRDSDSGSEESMDNVISMTTPTLAGQPNGSLSSFATTPKTRGPALNGTSTPGSTYSSFTTTTARQNSAKGKCFRACELAAPIPIEYLHPKPTEEEDDECRVFVDIRDLQRLKCFSGDWVALRISPCSPGGQLKSWDLDTLHAIDADDDFRVVRIYGLPDLSMPTSLRHPARNHPASHRRSSVAISSGLNYPTLQLWLSPIMHANLGLPDEVRLVPLTPNGASKQAFSPKQSLAKNDRLRYPSVAAEVQLAKISTPTSQEAAMQEIIFLKLKQHFESRRRLVKTGDLVAMTVDVQIGRLLGTSKPASNDGGEPEELLSLLTNSSQPDTSSLDVVWFKVGQITPSTSKTKTENQHEDIWGGVACVDPTTTRMTIGTSHQCSLPSALESSWRSYLGLLPTSSTRKLAGPISRYLGSMTRPYTSILQRRLRELIAAATSPRATNLGINPTLILLYSTQRHIGKAKIATQAASDLGKHTFSIDSYEIVSEGNAGEVQESGINTRIARGLSCGAQHTIILIRHVEALSTNRLTNALQEAAKDTRVLVATTAQLDQVPENMRSLFTHEIEMSAPDEAERQGILQNVIQEQGIRIAHDVDLAAIAVKTAALVAGNLVDIAERAVIARLTRLESLIQSTAASRTLSPLLIRDLVVSGGEWARRVTKADFDMAVDAARKNFADAIGAPKIPNVSWDDVGGLEHVKDAVMETIQLPLERPELFAKGMKKRSGILFYGPPGTGKTLLAKAIATEFSLNFFSVKGPELLNMYIGESEANVRRVFQRARDARPCVVFFDELDSVAPKRGNQGDSGGVMDRIVSQLLAELDGMSNGDDSGGGVFVIGATNRPDLLDQALLRPGRFDKMLYLGISDTHQKQRTILEALTRKFHLHSDLSLARVAESLPFTYTGADLYALCSDAMLKAITRQAAAVDRKIKALPGGPVSHAYFFERIAKEEDVSVCVTEEDFGAARRELVGSVSVKELQHYQRVRDSFETPSDKLPPPTTPPDPIPTRPRATKRTNTAIRSQPIDTNGKGKGKARSNDAGSDSSTDDVYVTSNDSVHTSPQPHRPKAPQGKGKGKATMIPRPVVEDGGFKDVAVEEEEEMYR